MYNSKWLIFIPECAAPKAEASVGPNDDNEGESGFASASEDATNAAADFPEMTSYNWYD